MNADTQSDAHSQYDVGFLVNGAALIGQSEEAFFFWLAGALTESQTASNGSG